MSEPKNIMLPTNLADHIKYVNQSVMHFDKGSDALEYFEGNCKGVSPSLVLLDINMPITDG